MEEIWVLPFGQFSSPWRGVTQEVILSVFFRKACISSYAPAPPLPGLLLLPTPPPCPQDLLRFIPSHFIQKLLDPVAELLPRSSSAFRIPEVISSFLSPLLSPPFLPSYAKVTVTSVYQRKCLLIHILFPHSVCHLHRSERKHCFSIRRSGFESPY